MDLSFSLQPSLIYTQNTKYTVNSASATEYADERKGERKRAKYLNI